MMKKYISIIVSIFLLIGCTKSTIVEPLVIGIIDTGFSSRAIESEYILEGKNYLDSTLSTEDTYGHGTEVASVILSNTSNVRLVPLVSNAFKEGQIIQVENDVLADMIVDAIDVYDCDIINISAGLGTDIPSIREAIEYAEDKDVLVVASVGNDYIGEGTFKYYPAGYDSVLAVGSINSKEESISTFSQRGEWVDIYAVGENVLLSTLSGSTRYGKGTSYSTARVSAYAASLLQENKTSSVSELRELILESAYTLEDGSKYISNKEEQID